MDEKLIEELKAVLAKVIGSLSDEEKERLKAELERRFAEGEGEGEPETDELEGEEADRFIEGEADPAEEPMPYGAEAEDPRPRGGEIPEEKRQELIRALRARLTGGAQA